MTPEDPPAPQVGGAGKALDDLGQVAIDEGKKTWKAAIKLVNATQAGVGKVPISNKIGKSAVDLDETNPLRIISLCSQRAIRAFGRSRASLADDGIEVVDVPEHTAPGTVEFPPEPDTYDVSQPAFKCNQLFQDDFADIRSKFNISERQFFAVLGLQEKRTESSFSVIGSGDASGKSPSFFFLSADQRFILKSCTKRDVATLTKILGGYRDHIKLCKEGNEDNSSLLPRYIGLYEFEFADESVPDVTLVCMTNFFAGAYEIHKKYDLKGSTYHRSASEKERAKKSPVYKDLDWMAEGRKLTFPTEEETESVRKRLERDTAFLRDNKLIDYSLLVGVHEIDGDEENQNRREAMHVLCSTSSKEIRYFGIVDILTPYVLQKKAETVFTGTCLCRPGISCQPPEKYQRRFMTFCKEEILAAE